MNGLDTRTNKLVTTCRVTNKFVTTCELVMSLVKTARCYSLPLAFALCVTCGSSHAQELRALEPGKPVERKIAGGETHSYQLKLNVGQFARIIVEQKRIDLAIALAAPDGKPISEANFTGAGGNESLSYEAATGGDYRIILRTVNAAAPKGSYLLRITVKPETTAEDKKLIAAELPPSGTTIRLSNTTIKRSRFVAR